MAKTVADSFRPRRLASVRRAMKKRQRITRWSRSSGNAEVMAATPAEIDTATVSV